MLADYFVSKVGAKNVVRTFEPGGTPLGATIRTALLHGDYKPNPETQLLLMMADRSENMHHIILPALEEGKTVISDRGYMSSMVFQQDSKVFSIPEIAEMGQKLMEGHEPTWITINACSDHIDGRLGERGEYENFEKAQIARQQEYLRRYKEATQMLGGHWIENDGTIEQGFQKILEALDLKQV